KPPRRHTRPPNGLPITRAEERSDEGTAAAVAGSSACYAPHTCGPPRLAVLHSLQHFRHERQQILYTIRTSANGNNGKVFGDRMIQFDTLIYGDKNFK